jgi:hypothetical protein
MNSFNVLATVDLLPESDLHLIVESYLLFYSEQTPKHQSKINLHLFSKQPFQYQHNSIPITKMGMNIYTHCTSDIPEIQKIFTEASILFLPIMEGPSPLVNELLVCGVPILSHKESILKKHIDRQIGLFSGSKNSAQHLAAHVIEDYAQHLDMLYFDINVQKILKKKATKKYRRKLNNGGQDIATFLQEGSKTTTQSVRSAMTP